MDVEPDKRAGAVSKTARALTGMGCKSSVIRHFTKEDLGVMGLRMKLNDYIGPIEVDDVTLAFPAHVIGVLIPPREDLPEEFQRNWGSNEHCELAEQAFRKGFSELVPSALKEGIDPEKAARHLRAVLGSFEPKHEHKIGAAGWLLSEWLKP